MPPCRPGPPALALRFLAVGPGRAGSLLNTRRTGPAPCRSSGRAGLAGLCLPQRAALACVKTAGSRRLLTAGSRRLITAGSRRLIPAGSRRLITAGSRRRQADPEDLHRAYVDASLGRPAARPVVEMTMPSALDPTLAPPGRHVVQAPRPHPGSARGPVPGGPRAAGADTGSGGGGGGLGVATDGVSKRVNGLIRAPLINGLIRVPQ